MSGSMEAVRRLLQFLMAFLALTTLVLLAGNVVTFPQDDHPWLLMLVLGVTAAVPISIWWRRFFPAGVAALAAVVGLAMYLLCSAWIGFLLTSPYRGPMSAEATISFGAIGVLGALWGLFLAFSTLLLDAPSFPPPFRRRAWKIAACTVPIAGAAAVWVGLHNEWLFR